MIVTIKNVLKPAQLEEISKILAKAEFVDGRLTAAGTAAKVKKNQQAKAGGEDLKGAHKLVLTALARNESFKSLALPLRVMPPLFSRYEPGMEYGDHIDKPIMVNGTLVRSDLALTLFLSDPESYDGGELVITSDFGRQKLKPAAGSLVLYPASTIHRVEPVTKGVRLAAVSWVQSMIRSHEQRQIVSEVSRSQAWAEKQDAKEALRLQKIRANLMRQWADV